MIPILREQIDKESLLTIFTLQNPLAERTAFIQELRDQVVKSSAESGKLSSSDGLKKPQTGTIRQKTALHNGGPLRCTSQVRCS
jgi:hypothetical protein